MSRVKGTVKTGGRRAGTPNRVGADVRLAARAYSRQALTTLANIMKNPKSHEASRVAAARELLDRAHGKPRQPLDGELRVGVSEALARYIAGNVGKPRNFLDFGKEPGD